MIRNKLTGNFSKLNIHNWLYNKPSVIDYSEIVEVKFKNTRKAFFTNPNKIDLKIGDYVAVEASPGHDVGVVSLIGPLIFDQINKTRNINLTELKRVYRKAKDLDLEKWREAIALEHPTMMEARRISANLKLDMKIGDVEYQGDKLKAIFYYIADERVDFRELIKIFAEKFKVRIEMKQIGARQEAGRIGGLGTCGRELCCSTWVNNFVSVATNAARVQELSLNPQKLAGQCSKLKCCLNFELDCYIDARKDFPSNEIPLESMEGKAIYQKTDVHKKLMWYIIDNNERSFIFPLSVDKVAQIIEMNKKGIKPEKFISKEESYASQQKEDEIVDYQNVVGQDSIDRFNIPKGKRRRKKKNHQVNE